MLSHLQRCCLCLLICLSTFLSTIVDCAETGTSKAAEDDGFIGVGDDIAKAVATFDALAFGRNDSCGSGLFYCDKKQGGKCIPEKWRCDQDFDCLDKTDEPSDCPPHPCKDGQFTCRLTGHCLPMRFRCDQEPDCGITIEGRIDDSDEEASTCNVTLSCPVNYHSCQTVNQCVHLSLFCNGKFDCPDNSDEHKKCSEAIPEIEQICRYGHGMTADAGVLCFCPEGKRPKGNDCVDEDECLRPKDGGAPVCDQLCTNLVAENPQTRGFSCSCVSGYTLINDTWCQAINDPIDEQPTVFVLTDSSLVHKKLGDLRGDKLAQVDSYQIQTFDYDHRRRRVCWVDRISHHGIMDDLIECAQIRPNGSLIAPWSNFTPEFNVRGVVAMKYDWIGRNWYMLDASFNRLFVCDYEFAKCVNIVSRQFEKPRDMAIDPTAGYAFITDWGMIKSGLVRVDLDGSNWTTLVDGGVIHPHGVSVDFATRTVYWLDAYLEYIHAIDYEKTFRRRQIVSGHQIKGLSSLAVFERRLYASVPNSHQIIIFDKMNGSTLEVADDFVDFRSIAQAQIFHRQRQPDGNHPCAVDNGGCTHICLPTYRRSSDPTKSVPFVTCRCQDGYIRGSDEKSCTPTNQRTDPILLFGRTQPGEIGGIPLDPPMAGYQSFFPVRRLKRPTAIAIDVKSDYVYFSDASNFTIYRKKIHAENTGGAIETVIDSGLNNCEGLAIDWAAGNLYWTDEGLLTINVAKLSNTTLRKVIVNTDLWHPRALVVHPLKGYLFWSDWAEGETETTPESSRRKAKIERSKLDGSERKQFVYIGVHWPNGLALDYENDFLYWCDAFYDRIERVRLDGQDRKVIALGEKVNHPYGIAIHQNMLFWSEFRISQINRLTIGANGDTRDYTVLFEDNAQLFELHIYDKNAQNTSTHCRQNNGGCDHFCFAFNEKIVHCSCAMGYVSDRSNSAKCNVDTNYEPAKLCKGEGLFECKRNKRCIDAQYLCDGDDDCGDLSDEDARPGGACEHATCNATEFRCSNNQCIDKRWVCDGEPDCADHDDESHCGDKPNCGKGKFQCAVSKRCISSTWQCDGVFDCDANDTSDEQNCEHTPCLSNQFRCLNDRCIAASFVCDGDVDCRDGSDENNCHQGCVPGLEFRCSEGKPCLSSLFRCDGIVDCSDGSDESNKTCPTPPRAHSCDKVNQFKCKGTDECIRLAFKCDGQKDCTDGSDEENCPPDACDPATKFACVDGSKCIPKKFVCDGRDDCIDKSDEKTCADIRSNPSRCTSPSWLCKNDTKNTCLPWSKVCDLTRDCPNGDDEDFLCENRLCRQLPCEQICRNRPDGFICDCYAGYALAEDKRKCIKSSPCGFGNCSQLCEPQGSHHYCHCAPGFDLLPDKFTCKSTDPSRPYVVYSNRHEIRLIGIDDTVSVPLVVNLRNSIALDFYYEQKDEILLFWTDIASDEIFRGALRGQVLTDIKPIINFGIWTAEGLAVDWLGMNLYWVDSSLDQIEVTNFDGAMRATVVSGNMQNLRALTLDPRMGLMFWTDWEESNPRIERATLAGQDRRVIFRVLDIDNGGWPNGLTIDFISERLYWIDAKSDSVHTILYDGGDHREILRDSALLTHPFAVSLFDSYVYWTDWRVNAIIRANKWNGTDVQIIEGTSAQPFDLKIIHPSRQPFSSKNPCRKNGRCSHICLINSTTTRLCACPHMMRLSPDNQTCLVVNQTLVYATPTNIVAMDILPPHTRLFPVLAGKSVEKVQALDFDAEEKIVYWADASSATIARVYLNGSGNVEVIVKSDLQNPNGIAVDWLSDNVYFTSWSEGDGMASISIASENGHYRRVLLNEKNGLQKPRDIVVDPQSGMMYWFDTINGSASLYQSFMDGTVMKKMSPSSESMADPRGLLLDVIHKRLLWIEQKSKTIFAFDIVSKNTRKITFVDKTAKPSLMTLDMANSQIIIYDDSEAGNSKISSSPLNDAFVADAQLQLIKNVSGVVLLKALDHELQGGDNACRIRPSPCSHHCVPLPDQGHRCLCAEGFDFVSGLCQPTNSFLLYADDDSLEAISILATHDLDQLSSIPRVNRPMAVAVDARREWIYWIDGESNELWKVKRDSTQSQLVLSGQNSKLAHIAVDWATGNVYLSSRVPGKTAIGVIEVVLSDNRKYTVVEEKRDVPRHLQVDSHNGYLFWLTSVGLHRSNLDGSNMKTLITSANLTDLALNLPDERLCFIEGNKTTLECTNYDGLNQRQAMDFSAIINAVTAIAVHGMQIFWYDRAMQGGSLLAGNLTSDGSLPNYLRMRRHRMNANVFDMTIYDKDSHITTNLCSNENGGCQDICFFYPDNRMKCACVFGQLAADGKTCEAYKAFLAYSRGRMIEFAPMTASSGGTGSANPAYPPIDSTEVIRSAVGVSFDYAQSLIFYSDIQLKRIVAVKFDGSDNFAVAENVGSVEGLAFDYLHKELYFTSYSNHSIMRVSVADPYTVAGNYPKATTRLLMLNDQDKPRGIAVDPCEMRIYWTNWREGLPSIERAYFSGFQREKLITTDIRTPNAITIDFLARKLYWSDARLDKIERCEMDGSNRQVLVSGDTIVGHYPAHPFGLVVYGNYLFYTDWITRGVVKMNKLTGGEAEFLRGNFTEQPMGVAAIAEDALQCGMDACTRANLGCQDVCRLTAAGQPHCACTGERTLSHDNRTCEEMAARCADVEYECTTTRRCIPYEETCDGVPDCPNKEDEAIDFCGTRECREGFFACGNGQCILAAKKCDGHNDCGNYRDETQCECRPGEFKCKSGMCVLLTKRCNNEMDCNDASDEMDNCAKRDCSKVEILKGKTSINCAKTTQCIVSDWLCDGQNDCWDNSDEKNCTTIQRTRPTSGRSSVCSQWQHKCKSTGTCIPKSWACDQQRDCADGSDEDNCERSCLQDEFECAASKNCIDLQLKCDGKKDCKDGSDEKDCPNDCDVAKSFKCRGNGRCIPKQWQCDGFDDCMDNSGSSALGSDEQNCDAVSIDFVIGCRADEFRCNSTHECIPRKNFCDGDKDCTDGSDEPPNCGKRYCPNSDFSCGDGQCIPISWICNQIPDCRDGSDEQETLCSGKGSCKNGQFLCDNGVCINETLTCDQKNDCGDRSDENRCNVNECMTDDPCDGVCIDKKIGFECLCDSPRKKLKKSSSGKMECLWANMCDDFPCSQFCMNKGENGFHCFCEEGYTLAPDQRTCRHTDSVQPLLLVANRHYLRLYTLKGRPKGILLSNLTNGVAVDYDYTSQRVYWSDVTLTSSHIGYTSLGNVPDTYKVIHPLPRENPDGVAVDWLAKNLYWCDKNNDAISVSTLDGRFRKTLLKGAPLQEPRAVVLDPIRRMLFWSDWGDQAHLGRMDMDGASPQIILSTSLGWPNALAIDATTQRLFWGDAKLDYIGSCNYDGSQRRVVMSGSVKHIFGLDIFEDFMYWSDWTNGTIERANKVTGKNHSVLISGMQYRPMGVKVVHPLLQRTLDGRKHVCQSIPPRCENLCLIADNRVVNGYRCECADNFRPHSTNEGKCVSNCKPTDFVCLATYKCLPFWWRCDGQDDCGDNMDEMWGVPGACPPNPCSPGQYKCNGTTGSSSTVCINPLQLCDGTAHCPLKDDEKESLCSVYECTDSQFKCPNGTKCISKTSVCDGTNDCGDNADEVDCGGQLINACDKESFACMNSAGKINRCIPLTWQCDGERDCPGQGDVGGSDEFNCAPRTCEPDQFVCGDGFCLSTLYVCDGDPDCHDKSDEQPNMCKGRTCGSKEFRCDTGKCIPLSWKCDGQPDCKAGDDEVGCRLADKCSHDQFRCTNDARCIAISWRCDGEPDCQDGTDEVGCATSAVSCSAEEFACLDGQRCLKMAQKCDSKVDCADASDEVECHACTNHTVACGAASTKCIGIGQICDKIIDCPDAWDEIGCQCRTPGYIQCLGSKTCIPNGAVCDGIKDCPDDGSDEDDRLCDLHQCVETHMKCKNNRCFPQSGFCDGVAQCEDGSDEKGDYCTAKCKGAFRCDNGRCVDFNLKCDGNDDCGDRSDEDNCDLSICEHFGLCSHRCEMSRSLPKCACGNGYIKESWNHNKCKALGEPAVIAFADGGMLKTMQLDKADVVKTKPSSNVRDMDFVWDEDRNVAIVFWIDAITKTINTATFTDFLDEPKSRVRRASSESDARLDIIANEPTALAVDWINNNIYFAHDSEFLDQGTTISVAKQKGGAQTDVIWGNLLSVTAIAVAPAERKFFWASSHLLGGTIETANLDGSERRAIVSRHIYNPLSITIDHPNGRLYWADSNLGSIETALLDGRDRRVIKKYGYDQEGKLHDRPVALEVFEDELFVVGRPTGMVWRLAKFGRSNETVMEHIRVNRPNKLLAIQKSKRIAYVDSPCTSSTCEDFVCVPESGNSSSYRCLCPRGLHPFGSTCVPHENVNASTACGEAVCLNGGTCLNPFTNECQCPASTWKSAGSRQCEFNQCHNFCLNGGTCSVAVANSAPTCTCPKDYAGARCGQYKCTGRCGAHGDCFVSDEDGLAHCRCDLGWSGEQCDIQIDICAGYCFTGGRCSLTQNGAPFCECPSDYHGRRCENCVVQSKTELVCRNGGHCVDKQSCECPLGYAGTNCERDLCRGYCNNGGICMRNETGGPKCKCPQGFSGLTCDEDWCLAVNRRCLNGGICMHDRPTGPYCYCPSKFKGDRCETARSCEEYCQNNGTCRGESNSKQWKCNCKHGYTGDRCETQPACQGKCQNGALCQSQPSDPNNPVCICPAGLSGPSCMTLVATNCDELDCRNGAPCIVREAEPRCACPFGWTGLLCTEPLCIGYCLHGGECLIREHRTLCSCLPLWTGDRCEFSKVGGISTEDINDDGTLGQIITVIVPVTVLLVLAIVLLYVVFVRRPGAARQFKHERLSEPRPDLDEYQNPVFMHGEEDEAAVTEATNFTNPMYDSVYNDTVTTVAPSGGDTAEHRGLLPRSRLEIRSEDA